MDVLGANSPEQLDFAEHYSKEWSFNPTDFVLFLAKIAYCGALFMNGPWSFDPVLGPLIAAEKDDEIIPYVGGYGTRKDPRKEDTSFLVNVRTTPEWIWAEVSPFAHLGAPSYQVFVGRPKAASIARSWPDTSMQWR